MGRPRHAQLCKKLHPHVVGSEALSGSDLGPVDKLIGPEADGGDVYEAEVAC